MSQYHLSGIVVHGQQLGRTLGFPTANLAVDTLKDVLPPAGVYAAWATLSDGSHYLSMVNIGYRPTVDNLSHTLTVEAYLDQFSGDLYGQMLSLQLVSRIRDERKMSSLQELQEQLARDLEQVRKTAL